LIPDFAGNLAALETVVNSGIEILNHNIETVPRLYGKVRPGHSYECSLNVLREAKRLRRDPSTRAPTLAEGSRSGFRPTGVLKGATGLPVGFHEKAPSVARLHAKS
jgi:hypothetical protein